MLKIDDHSIPLVEFSDRVLLRGRLFFAPAFVGDDQSYYPNRQQASKRKLLRAGKYARLSPELLSAVDFHQSHGNRRADRASSGAKELSMAASTP